MRHFGKARKSAKDTDDVLKSQIHQAIKAVSKAVKTVKGLLVLKCSKKIATLRETGEKGTVSNDNKLEEELARLERLKTIDHQVIGAAIVRAKVLFGSDPKYNQTDKALDNTINIDILNAVLRHKVVEGALADIQTKITATIAKNNDLRAKEQAKTSKTAAKSLFSKKDGYVDGSKAVFMDSLSSDAANAEKKVVSNKDLVKLNKSLRNQANRLANRTKKGNEETEAADQPYTKRAHADGQSTERNNKRQRREGSDPSMMMYRPLDQRFSLPSSNTGTSSGVAKDNKKVQQNNQRASSARNDHSATGNSRTGATTRPKLASAAHPAAVAEDLTHAASFGKEWQKTGVHPSWAAKQHAKQQTVGAIPSAGAGPVAGQGKKIVFDD
jgi:hypothetical protein